MKSVFISYRRADSRDVTGRIYDSLAEWFGDDEIFRDIDSIPITNMTFPDFLKQALDQTRVVLVVIGPSWLSVSNETGQRRIDESDDYVRMEIETALRNRIPTVPILVGDAEMPSRDSLPESIRILTLQNAVNVRPDPDFHHDIKRLHSLLSDLLRMDGVQKVPLRGRVENLETLRNVELGWESEENKHRVWYCLRSTPNGGTWLALFALFLVAGVLLGRVVYSMYWYDRISSMGSKELAKYIVEKGGTTGFQTQRATNPYAGSPFSRGGDQEWDHELSFAAAQTMAVMIIRQMRDPATKGEFYRQALKWSKIYIICTLASGIIGLEYTSRLIKFRRVNSQYRMKRSQALYGSESSQHSSDQTVTSNPLSEPESPSSKVRTQSTPNFLPKSTSSSSKVKTGLGRSSRCKYCGSILSSFDRVIGRCPSCKRQH